MFANTSLFAAILSTKHDLNVAFPVQANGFIEVQSPQRHDVVFPIQRQAMQLGAFYPVVGRQVAGMAAAVDLAFLVDSEMRNEN